MGFHRLTSEQVLIHAAWFAADKAHSTACFADKSDVKAYYAATHATEEALRLANNACAAAQIQPFEHQEPIPPLSDRKVDPRVAEVIALYPAEFGIREYPIETFRFAAQDCYVVDGRIVLDVERCVGGEWRPLLILSVEDAAARIFTLP